MSGVEILGIAASVIQIADLGARLSVKLFVFSRKIKRADKSIESISQDIAVTGAILKQLADEISKDENADLITKEALKTTNGLISSCQKVFTALDSELDGRVARNTTLVSGWKSRVKFALLEAQIDLLRSNLERLKSSLLLMLNVLTFAVQVRSHRNVNALKDHRALVETLIQDKNASDKRYEQAKQALEWKDSLPTPNGREQHLPSEPPRKTERSHPVSDRDSFINAAAISLTASTHPPAHENVGPSSTKNSALPLCLRRRIEENQHHGTVIEDLLLVVQAPKYKITYDFREKLHQSILRVHWDHWSPLREVYMDSTLMNAFSKHPDVVRYWLARFKQEALSRSASRFKNSDRPAADDDTQRQLRHNARALRGSAHLQILEATSPDRSQRSSTTEHSSVQSPGLSTEAHSQMISASVQSKLNGNSFATNDEPSDVLRDIRKRTLSQTIVPAPPKYRTPTDVMRDRGLPRKDQPRSNGTSTPHIEVDFRTQSRRPDIISPYARGKTNDRIGAYAMSSPGDSLPPSTYSGLPPAGASYPEYHQRAGHPTSPNPKISAVANAGRQHHRTGSRMDETTNRGPQEYARRRPVSDIEIRGTRNAVTTEALTAMQSPSEQALRKDENRSRGSTVRVASRSSSRNWEAHGLPERKVDDVQRTHDRSSSSLGSYSDFFDRVEGDAWGHSADTPMPLYTQPSSRGARGTEIPSDSTPSVERKPLSVSKHGRVGMAISRMAGSKRAGNKGDPSSTSLPDSVTIIGSHSESLPPTYAQSLVYKQQNHGHSDSHHQDGDRFSFQEQDVVPTPNLRWQPEQQYSGPHHDFPQVKPSPYNQFPFSATYHAMSLPGHNLAHQTNTTQVDNKPIPIFQPILQRDIRDQVRAESVEQPGDPSTHRFEEYRSAQMTRRSHFRSEDSVSVSDTDRRRRLPYPAPLGEYQSTKGYARKPSPKLISGVPRGSSDSSASRPRERKRERRSSAKKPIIEEDLPYKFRKELDLTKMSRREEEERERKLKENQSVADDPFTKQPGRYMSGLPHGLSPLSDIATCRGEDGRKRDSFTSRPAEYELFMMSDDAVGMNEGQNFGPIESSFDDYIARWTQISSIEYKNMM